MKDQTLQAIDGNLISAAKFLEHLVSDYQSSKMKCLESYVDCQDVVQWIRKETKGTCIIFVVMWSYIWDSFQCPWCVCVCVCVCVLYIYS